jgi:hypothetical protein
VTPENTQAALDPWCGAEEIAAWRTAGLID